MWRLGQPAAQGAGVNPEMLADLWAGVNGPKTAIVLVVARIEHGGTSTWRPLSLACLHPFPWAIIAHRGKLVQIAERTRSQSILDRRLVSIMPQGPAQKRHFRNDF